MSALGRGLDTLLTPANDDRTPAIDALLAAADALVASPAYGMYRRTHLFLNLSEAAAAVRAERDALRDRCNAYRETLDHLISDGGRRMDRVDMAEAASDVVRRVG